MQPITTEESVRRYLDDIRKIEVMKKADEKVLFDQYQSGSRAAKERLIKGHMRFVVQVALHFRNMPLPISDLISEGAIGLIKAIETFDNSRGLNFISYAVWWIRSYIVQAVQKKGSLIRVPANQLLRISKENRESIRDNKKTQQYRQLLNISRPDCAGEEGWHSLGHLQSHLNFAEQEKQLTQTKLIASMHLAISQLPTREAFVVKNLYGIHRGDTETLETIADRMGLSPERIRQLKNKALKRLKTNQYCKQMAECVE